MNIKTEDLNPVLLKSSVFDGYSLTAETKMASRIVYDYEIEYYLQSEGGIEIDGEFIPFSQGNVNIRKPGQMVRGILPYSCYLISIDFFGDSEKCCNYTLGTSDKKQPLIDNDILNCLPNKINSPDSHNVGSLMKKIHDDFIYNSDIDKISIKGNLYNLLREIYTITNNKMSTMKIYNSNIKKSLKYISQNYINDINVSQLIEMSGLCKAHFHKMFRECTGCTPNQYITSLRIERSKYLLEASLSDISEVAYNCGYYDSVYFSFVFKKYTGMTPSQYRIKKNAQ